MPEYRPSVLERAFEIADAGRVSYVSDIRYQLLAEGFSVHEIQGRVLIKQLLARITAAKLSSSAP
jgi:hypothetical protein